MTDRMDQLNHCALEINAKLIIRQTERKENFNWGVTLPIVIDMCAVRYLLKYNGNGHGLLHRPTNQLLLVVHA